MFTIIFLSRKGKSLKEKIKCKCHFCKKKFWLSPSEIKLGYGKFCSQKCYGLSKRGKNNWNWKGGIGKEPYPFNFNEELKELIRKRDGYICQLCNNYGKDVHHIDYDKKNCNPTNLICLCNKCNSKVNANREYWTELFQAGIY